MEESRKTSRWQPGQTGNPNGRPRGSGEVARLREAISVHVPKIIEQLVEQAKGGDLQASRLLLERVFPPVKASEQPVELDLGESDSLTSKANAILHAAANGHLAPSQAAQLISAVGSVAKIVEIDELEARISKLEKRNA